MFRRPAITRYLLAAALVVSAVQDAASQASFAPSSQGSSQGPQQPAPADQPPPESAPASAQNPGLLNELGKMFKGSSSLLPDLKSPREALDGLTKAAAPGSLVTGRAACPVAGNGAPDCKAGADELCRSKGYTQGRSLDSDSAQTCSAKYALSGKPCRMEHFVTRAACQ